MRIESKPRVSQEQQRGRGFGSLGHETRPQERMGFELASEGCGDGAQNTWIPLLYFGSALEAEAEWPCVYAHSCTKQRAGRYDGVRSCARLLLLYLAVAPPPRRRLLRASLRHATPERMEG